MTPEEQSDMDQNLAHLREVLPGMVWALFIGFKEKGFKDDEAMSLTKAYVHGLGGGKYQG